MDPTKASMETGSFTEHPSEEASDSTSPDGRNEMHESPPKVLGDYELGPEIGRGGMGVVYLARETKLGRKVALKVLPKQANNSDIMKRRFFVEARAAAQLNHSNIVPIFHIGEDDGTPFFAMQLIEGHNLAEILNTARRALSNKGRSKTTEADAAGASTVKMRTSTDGTDIDLSDASFSGSFEANGYKSASKLAKSVALLGQQVADALHHAHEHGIIHRDIKPSNLLLDEHNRIWVSDFGLAQFQDAPALTRTGDIVGTLRYMSPEQASGRRAFVDNRTDIYSLGVALYELATLRPACQGSTAREILREVTFERPIPIRKHNPRLPVDFETIICKATERNPSDRYQTAAEFAADLQRFANNEPLSTRRTSKLKHLRDWLYERPLYSASIAIGAVVLLCALAGMLIAVNQNRIAQVERLDEVSKLLTLTQGANLNLLAGQAILERNFGKAVAMALDGAERAPGVISDQMLQVAINGNHELKTVSIAGRGVGDISYDDQGEGFVLCTHPYRIERGTSSSTLFREDISGALRSETLAGITSAAFSPDGRLLLTATSTFVPRRELADIEYKGVQVLSAADLKLLRPFKGVKLLQVSHQNFDRDGRVVLPASNGQIDIYVDASKGNRELALTGFDGQALLTNLSPNGAFAAASLSTGKVLLWDGKQGGESINAFTICPEQPSSIRLEFSPDSKWLLITSKLGTRILFTEQPEVQITRQETEGVFTGYGSHVLFKSRLLRRLVIYDPMVQQVVQQIESSEPITQFACSRTGDVIATSYHGTIRLFRTSTGSEIAELHGHEGDVFRLAFRPNSDELTSCGRDETVRIWSVQSNVESRTIATEMESFSEPLVGYSSDGKRAVLASSTGELTRVYSSDGVLSSITLDGDVVVVLDNAKVISAQADTLTARDAASWREIDKVRIPDQQIASVVQLGKQDRVAVRTRRNDLFLWSLASKGLLKLNRFDEQVRAVAVLSDSELIIGLADGRLLRQNIENFQRTEVTRFEGQEIRHVAINEARESAALTLGTGQVLIMALEDSEERTLVAHDDLKVTQTYFARNDELLIADSSPLGTQLAFWSIADKEFVKVEDVGRIRSTALSDDKTRFSAATVDSGALLWSLATLEHVEVASQAASSVHFIQEYLIVALEMKALFGMPAWSLPELGNEGRLQKPELMIWDIDNSRESTRTNLIANASSILNAGGKLLINGKAYGVDIVELENGDVERSLMHPDTVILAEFVDDDSEVVSVSRSGRVMRYDLDTAESTLVASHEQHLVAAVLSSDRKKLYVADSANTLQLLDLDASSGFDLIGTAGDRFFQMEYGNQTPIVVSIHESSELMVWDLLTRKPKPIEFPDKLRSAQISPNDETILVVLGARNTFPSAGKPLRGEPDTPAEIVGAYLVDWKSGEQRKIRVPGVVMDGRFVNNGSMLALLTNRGEIEVVDSQTLERKQRIRADQRLAGLFEVENGSQVLYASGNNRIYGWDVDSWTKAIDFPVDNSHRKAAERSAQWQIDETKSEWLLFESDGRIVRQNKDAMKYVSDHAPKRLSENEIEQILGLDVIE